MSKDFKTALRNKFRGYLYDSDNIKFLASKIMGSIRLKTPLEELDCIIYDDLRTEIEKNITSDFVTSIYHVYKNGENSIKISLVIPSVNGVPLDKAKVFEFEFSADESVDVEKEGLTTVIDAVVAAVVDTITGTIIVYAKEAIAKKDRLDKANRLQAKYKRVPTNTIETLGKQLSNVIEKLNSESKDDYSKTIKFSSAELSIDEDGCIIIKLIREVDK